MHFVFNISVPAVDATRFAHPPSSFLRKASRSNVQAISNSDDKKAVVATRKKSFQFGDLALYFVAMFVLAQTIFEDGGS